VTRWNVRIRPAERSDVDALVALIRSVESTPGRLSGHALLDPSDARLTERLADLMGREERTLLVAADEHAGELVGLLVACRDDVGVIDLMPVLHVTHLLVAPTHRRRGVGRALLLAGVHLADELGLDRMLATPAAGSREANRYLARLGFAPLAVHRIASTTGLCRSLGLADAPERLAVMRRARLVRAQRAGRRTVTARI
jgi:GNAT superfamily N-acetyltransferase